MKVFYDERQSVAGNASFSPSAGKPAQVVATWRRLDIPFDELPFSPLTADDIALAHDRSYVEGVLSGALQNGYGNHDPAMAAALPWVSGSMVAAALHSYCTRETSFSPTSGAHHACYGSGGDYCTFNFLVIAAIKARQAGARRVGILDLDYHYGNGTDDIIRRLDLGYIRHYTAGGDHPDGGEPAERWLKRLPGIVYAFQDVELIIYNAGVDSHVRDPLGGNLTTEQLARRDRIVFETAHAVGVPICASLAGGYQVAEDGSFDAVLNLHAVTFRAAWEARNPSAGIVDHDNWSLW